MKQPIPFGKYFLLERVNVGGMAEVFKAKATGVEGFERLVAVKRILPSIAEDEEFITMFIDEAKIAVQLTHANIAQIFDLGKVSDAYFIALEYVQGKDLRAIFNRARQRNEPVPIPMACYTIMKVCEGLEYAHQKRDATGQFLNLVHRDVSPQNLLVSYEGEVKIIDFGIAKAVGKQGMTQAGILKGKFGYMSPEQVQGLDIDRRSDIFGLGICLYELLTGERLFVAETDFATLEKVRAVDIMPPSTYNRRIPEELEQIVLKALARDRDQRHQTAMDLHDDLQSFLYASGSYFGRKELSAHMHEVFSEEIKKEHLRDQEYAELDLIEENTGLHSFEDLDPVSAVSALNDGLVQSSPAPAMATPAPLPNKSTLLGIPQQMGAGMIAPAAHSVPPPVPAPGSIPPGHALPPSATTPGLGMEWDDDELSTQIYDRPEDLSDAMLQAGHMPGPIPSVPPGQGSLPPGGSVPPALHASPGLAPPHSGPPPGQPSPFAPVPAAPLPPQGAPLPLPYSEPISAAEIGGRQSQPRSLIGAVVAVMVILGLVVGGLLIFQPAKPGVIHLRTTPDDATVSIDGVEVTGTSPFVLQDIAPGTPHLVEVSQDGHHPWSSKVEVQPGQTMVLPPVALKAIESGFALDSVPSDAIVVLNGRELPEHTPVRLTDLPSGKHTVLLRKEGYAPWEVPLNIESGRVLELPNAVLSPEAGEQEDGRAGRDRRLRQPRPERSASSPSASPPRREPIVRTEPEPESEPEVEEEEPVHEVAAAGGGTGTLRVNTRPWSIVYIDGNRVGNTPQMNISLDSGPHELTLVNDDFGIRKSLTVTIKPDEVVTRVLTLSP